MKQQTKMRTVKVLLCCILAMLLCGVLYGCSNFLFALHEAYQNLKTDTSEVEVEIYDEYYREAYTNCYYGGNGVFVYDDVPAVYEITVIYNKRKYTIRGEETYNKYKDKVGEIATGILKIQYYDKKTGKKIVSSQIVSLK